MPASFQDLRVISFDSRLSDEMRNLIERLGGRAIWAPSIRELPISEDPGPLHAGIRAVADRQVEVMVFTSAQQLQDVLQVAGDMGLQQAFRDAARQIVIGSLDPTCSKALIDSGLGFDFEPDSMDMGGLIHGLARSTYSLLARKRASHASGIDVTRARRVDLVWSEQQLAELHDSPFMRACRGEPAPYTPIWLMRQAGRYQREYRELRAKVSFLELCKTPELAAEVTLMAVDQLGVDAAIIFADILLIVEPMGVGLAFNKGEGPSIARPVRTGADVDALKDVPVDALQFVYDAITMTRRALKPDVPLIGFAGAPFTVASYMVEGGGSRNFVETKSLMYRDPGAWHALMERLVNATAGYLTAQIAAGAQVLQIFDSWVGCLSEADYREFVLPHSRRLIERVKNGNELPRSSDSGCFQPVHASQSGPRQCSDTSDSGPRQFIDATSTPIIHFGADSGHLLRAMREAGGNVIGLDWRTDLDKGWDLIGHDRAVQGNLDPVTLFATRGEIERRSKLILDQAAGRSGHIFNLGHGILPGTPVENVLALIDFVHDNSQR